MLQHEFVCSNLIAFFQHSLKGYKHVAPAFLNNFEKNAAKNCVFLYARQVKVQTIECSPNNKNCIFLPF